MTRVRNSFALRGIIALPLLVLGIAGGVTLSVAWIVLIVLFLTLLMEGPGKYPALFMAGGLWIWAGAFIAAFLPGWGILPVVFAAAFVVLIPAIRIGQDWGGRRYAAMTSRGKPMREWEWVYVGRSFAQAHASNRFCSALGFMALSLVASLVLWWLALGYLGMPRSAGLVATACVIYGLTLIALLRRWPVAYPLVFLCLAPVFPLSLPLILYWADGVRPNLIYRHRFERLVPKETADV